MIKTCPNLQQLKYVLQDPACFSRSVPSRDRCVYPLRVTANVLLLFAVFHCLVQRFQWDRCLLSQLFVTSIFDSCFQ